MTWTYAGSPGTDTADERRDAVRLLIGDNDSTEQIGISDEEIAFALSQADNNIYKASAILSRALAGKYSRLADTSFDGVSTKNSQLSASYMELARKLEQQAAEYGTGLIGSPLAGGTKISDIGAALEDTDRVPSAFTTGQFRNPQGVDDEPWRQY